MKLRRWLNKSMRLVVHLLETTAVILLRNKKTGLRPAIVSFLWINHFACHLQLSINSIARTTMVVLSPRKVSYFTPLLTVSPLSKPLSAAYAIRLLIHILVYIAQKVTELQYSVSMISEPRI